MDLGIAKRLWYDSIKTKLVAWNLASDFTFHSETDKNETIIVFRDIQPLDFAVGFRSHIVS